jgi:hypothetical protein
VSRFEQAPTIVLHQDSSICSASSIQCYHNEADPSSIRRYAVDEVIYDIGDVVDASQAIMNRGHASLTSLVLIGLARYILRGSNS